MGWRFLLYNLNLIQRVSFFIRKDKQFLLIVILKLRIVFSVFFLSFRNLKSELCDESSIEPSFLKTPRKFWAKLISFKNYFSDFNFSAVLAL